MKRGNVSDKKEIKSTTIICPHCGEDVNVRPGSLMGKLSGASRVGQSMLMRELVELRWAKQNKLKIVKAQKVKTKVAKSVTKKVKSFKA